MTTITDTRPSDNEERECRLLALLQRVWTFAITTKSDYARDYADEIAQAASAGFITTQVPPGYDQPAQYYGRLWKVTPDGLNFLYENASRIAAQEVAQYEADYVETPAND